MMTLILTCALIGLVVALLWHVAQRARGGLVCQACGRAFHTDAEYIEHVRSKHGVEIH
jgi:hypothetical protein